MVEQRLGVADRVVVRAERSDAGQAVPRRGELVEPVEQLVDRGDRLLVRLGRRATLRAAHSAPPALAGMPARCVVVQSRFVLHTFCRGT